jgi:hypothetical protein
MTDVAMCTVALKRAANREDRGLEQMSRRRQLMRLRDLQREAEEERSRRAYYCDPEQAYMPTLASRPIEGSSPELASFELD